MSIFWSFNTPHNHQSALSNRHFSTYFHLAGNILPPAEIHSHLQYILNDTTTPPEHPVGYLTSENRDVWASLRQQLESSSGKNSEILDKIDTAAYCLCLDDTAPVEAEDMNRNMLYGNGANRYICHILVFDEHV